MDRRIASLSGSDDASDIAELRKLQAERRKLQEDLDDTYYNHAMDSQSDALNNEAEAYKQGKDNYLEMLRETLDDTQAIINQKIAEVLSNADTVLTTINTTAGEHGVTLSTALTQPWTDAATTASAFKTGLDETLPLMTNEDGVITVFSSAAKSLLTGVFGAASTAASDFKTAVDTQLGLIKTAVEASSSDTTSKLKFPWDDTSKEDGPITTFSTKAKGAIGDAVTEAQTNAEAMKSYLSSPWNNASTAVNTFSTNVATALDNNLAKVAQHVKDINAENAKIVPPDYVGTDGTDASSDTNGTVGSLSGKKPKTITKYSAIASVQANGKDFSQSASSAKSEEDAKKQALSSLMTSVINYMGNWHMSTDQAASLWEKTWSKKVKYKTDSQKVSAYATGTLGTKRDEWAITDEIGDELVMYATPEGRLSYMRAGSTVVPHDLTKELISLGEVGLDGLRNMSQVNSGINLMSNYVQRPEFNLTFDALVKAEHIDENTLPEVKKFVQQEINSLVKQMNYAIRGKGGR